jgi:hypothetical protein
MFEMGKNFIGPGMMAHICISSTVLPAEAEGSYVQGQPGKNSETGSKTNNSESNNIIGHFVEEFLK